MEKEFIGGPKFVCTN